MWSWCELKLLGWSGQGRRRPCLLPASTWLICILLATAAPVLPPLQVLECLAAGEEPPDISEAVAADPTLPSWEADVAELERQLAELQGAADGMGVELRGKQLEEAQRLQEKIEEQRQLATVIEGFKARRHRCVLCMAHTLAAWH